MGTWRSRALEEEDNAMLGCVGDNTLKSLARFLPEAFRKHHDDLELLDDGRVVWKEAKH